MTHDFLCNFFLKPDQFIFLDVSEINVTCYIEESCILPCSFQEGPEVVIRWTKLTLGYSHVHSFYKNQDQLGDQDQNFRGRTSLFKDQISRGNASLLLTGVKFQDQGQYQCYTNTTSGVKTSIINLNVDGMKDKVKCKSVFSHSLSTS